MDSIKEKDNSAGQWHVFVNGRTSGPHSFAAISRMLKQKQVSPADFMWTEGLNEWTRLMELRDFQSLLPPYPPVAVPDGFSTSNLKKTDVPRWYHRVLVDAHVILFGQTQLKVIDISEGGLFVEAKKGDIPSGTDLKLKIESTKLVMPLEMTGVVIREGISDNGQAGLGIQFTRVNPLHRRIIRQLVESEITQIRPGKRLDKTG